MSYTLLLSLLSPQYEIVYTHARQHNGPSSPARSRARSHNISLPFAVNKNRKRECCRCRCCCRCCWCGCGCCWPSSAVSGPGRRVNTVSGWSMIVSARARVLDVNLWTYDASPRYTCKRDERLCAFYMLARVPVLNIHISRTKSYVCVCIVRDECVCVFFVLLCCCLRELAQHKQSQSSALLCELRLINFPWLTFMLSTWHTFQCQLPRPGLLIGRQTTTDR